MIGSTPAPPSIDPRERTAFDEPAPRDEVVDQLDRRSPLRAVTEAFISLILAVVLFRTFAAEGYMISTGSMAPSLLGYHKRVTCPTCGCTFPFGVAYDTDPDEETESTAHSRTHATCPNCDQSDIQVGDVPRNHGDQLLVSKQAFHFRQPRRWEVIVFKNPGKPSEAYVKRVVGLPTERIRLVRGDVEINGELVHKSLDDQLQTRILMHDADFRPAVKSGHAARWEPAGTSKVGTGWQSNWGEFTLKDAQTKGKSEDSLHWMGYYPGEVTEAVSVPLSEWPGDLDPTSIPPAGLEFDPDAGVLTARIPLTPEIREFLLAGTGDDLFREAVDELYTLSHARPLLDRYGYNPPDEEPGEVVVRDIMLELQLQVLSGLGEFAVELQDGLDTYRVLFDFSRGDVRIHRTSDERPIATAGLPSGLSPGPANVLVSLFDRQLLIAVNNQPLLPPLLLGSPSDRPQQFLPARFGGRGLDAVVSKVRLYRDVHYTGSGGRNGIDAPYQLGAGEYFVLGDNSPVSHDSRRWYDAPVPEHLIIGKPFLVHLPSKPGKLRVGSREMVLRLPDWSRVRWIP